MATNRLADILKQEYKTKGILGGSASAFGKKSLEVIDIRNALFGGSGIGSAVGQKIFGKGYRAIKRSDTSPSSVGSRDLSGVSAGILEEINQNTKIFAKNSLAIPSMARDMFLVKQNIVKMVKLQGGKPQTKSGDWFSRQAARESAYESQFGKKSPTPVTVANTKSESGSGILSFLGSTIGALGKAIGGAVVALGGVLEKAIEAMGKIIAAAILGRGALSALPGGKGKPIPVPGKKGAPVPKGGGRGGFLKGLMLLLGGGAVMNSFGGDDSVGGDIGGDGGAAAGSPLSQLSDKLGEGTSIAGSIAATYGAYKVGGAITDKLDNRVAGAAGGKTNVQLQDMGKSGSRFTTTDAAGKKSIVSGKNLPLGDVMDRMRKFADKASKKGWTSRIYGRVVKKFGIGVALRVSGFLAGLAAAPFSAGASALISAALAAWTIYDLYMLYDFFFGENGGLEKELEDEDAKIASRTSPTATPTPPPAVTPAAAPAANEKNSTPTPVSDPTNAGSGKEVSNLPTIPNSESGRVDPSKTTFADLTPEQQTAFMQKQFDMESGKNPNSLAYKLNNPGAMLYADWQKKYGGQLAGPEYGVGSVKGKFAKFPTLEAGLEAQRALWLSPAYANLPLDKALNKWVTGNPNSDMDVNMQARNTGYKNAIYAAIGSPQSTQVASNTPKATVASASNTPKGQTIDTASRTVADARTATAAAPQININDVKTLGSNFGQKTMNGFVERATPYDRDFYAGVTNRIAL